MANCLRLAIALSIRCPSSSAAPPQRRRTYASINNRNVPMPPMNPKDPFLSMLASVAASSPNTLLNQHQKSDTLPYMDIFDSAHPMATFAQVKRSDSKIKRRARKRPPDLPSMFLAERIVYIGMPLVPAVSELVIIELMFLQWMDPKKPIYLYINSTGTTDDDGETVAMETEGFAIYDCLMHLKNEIHTVAIGTAIGHACLLLSAGTKGKRYMMPNAKVMIHQPSIPSLGLMPASDVFIRAKEVIRHRDTFVKLFARHTRNSEEVVANLMEGILSMDAAQAVEFGVADKIFGAAVPRKLRGTR